MQRKFTFAMLAIPEFRQHAVAVLTSSRLKALGIAETMIEPTPGTENLGLQAGKTNTKNKQLKN